MKIITIFLVFACVSILLGCTMAFFWCTQPIKKSMTEYYSNDQVYSWLEGRIISIGKDRLLVEVITSNGEFSFREGTNRDFFMLTNLENFELQEDDIISFKSAPRQFFDGHNFPIVAIEKNGIIVLDYEAGKENLLNWIKFDFK